MSSGPSTEGSGTAPQQPAPSPRQPQPSPPRPQYTRPLRLGDRYTTAERRERTRSWLAIALVTLISVVAIGLIGLTALGELTIDEAKDLAGVVLAPLIAVSGTVFGFYYGGQKSD